MKRKTGYLIRNFNVLVYNVTYTLSCAFIFLVLMVLIPDASLVLTALISLGFLVLCLLGWAYLNVLFTIPQKLSAAYDTIKNAIALNEITGIRDYCRTLNSFLYSFFDFSFLDVQYSAIQLGQQPTECSSEKIEKVLDWELITERSRQSADIQKHGKLNTGKERFYGYTVPIWFDSRPLGHFTVFSRQRLGALRLKVLDDLEDNYIDDQAMYMLNRENG